MQSWPVTNLGYFRCIFQISHNRFSLFSSYTTLCARAGILCVAPSVLWTMWHGVGLQAGVLLPHFCYFCPFHWTGQFGKRKNVYSVQFIWADLMPPLWYPDWQVKNLKISGQTPGRLFLACLSSWNKLSEYQCLLSTLGIYTTLD